MFENLDGQAVDAVKTGDIERYRELVERYERKVYAIAWCRLGDADLAEEATQEAFIKGYRRLRLLNHGEKFAAWIAAIARNVAINLGLRRRSELRKRQRWALALSISEGVGTGATDPSPGEDADRAETLQQTLAALPAQHRECLALFYLQGKSVAEAASLLGISEAAFKTRLHRARGLMRERLEAQLGESLGRLRPARLLAPAVMAFVENQPLKAAALGGGVGVSKVLASIAQLLPFQWLLLQFAMLLSMIPGLWFGYWLGRTERKNFSDSEGFRVQIHQRMLSSRLRIVPIVILAVPVVAIITAHLLGGRVYASIIGLAFLLWWLGLSRWLRLSRTRYLAYELGGGAVIVAGSLGIGLLGLPAWTFLYFQSGFLILVGLSFYHKPSRLDYSLFLRAAQGMLPRLAGPMAERCFAGEELWRFARFLGNRGLAVDYRWSAEGIRLLLAPVRPTLVWPLRFPFYWRGYSFLTLGRDGRVEAVLGRIDETHLASLPQASPSLKRTLQQCVGTATRAALTAFLAGETGRAEELVGQLPEATIFRQPPRQSKAVRWGAAVVIGAGLLVAVFATFSWRWHVRDSRGRWAELRPVSVTEFQIQAALNRVGHAKLWRASSSMDDDLWRLLVLPPKKLFTPAAWNRFADDLWRHSPLNGQPGRTTASSD